MSTTFLLHRTGKTALDVVESSAKFDVEMYDMDHWLGINSLTPEEALRIASRMIYAVWCSYPEQADAMVAALAKDIPNHQEQP
jgi:hypothetical protein